MQYIIKEEREAEKSKSLAAIGISSRSGGK